MNARELRDRRQGILEKANGLVTKAEGENRDFSAEEQTQYDDLLSEASGLEKRIQRLESTPAALQTSNVRKTKLGDSEQRAFAHYFKTGDASGIGSLRETDERGQAEFRVNVPTGLEMRATDEIMNVAAAADGQAAVPTGFSGRIAARRNEVRLAERLGVTMVPGVGTTVNYPYENADPAVFAATSEQVDALTNTYERDRPTLAVKAFTLAKKTKKLVLTEELLDDEDANLMGFISDHIGRSIGMTHNSLLITEAAANGTALKTFASATVIAVGEPEQMVYHDTLSFYLDDGGAIAWVMRPSVFGEVKSLTTTARFYDAQQTMQSRSLLEYPVYYSSYPGATAASAKSLYFGNWSYMGMREDPALRFIRDPYSTDGVVILKYSFRTVYGVLIAGALGYGVHPSA